MNPLYILLNSIVPFTILSWLTALPLYNQTRRSKRFNIIIMALVVLLSILLSAFFKNFYKPVLLWIILLNITYVVMTICVCKIIFKCSIFKILFVYFICKSYLDDIFLLTKIIQTYVMNSFFPDSPPLSLSITYPIVLIITLPLISLFMVKLLRPLIEDKSTEPYWLYLWIATLSFYIMYKLGISPNYPSPEVIWNNTDVFLPLVWSISTFFVYFILLRMLLKMTMISKYQKQLHISELQFQQQKEHFQMLHKNIEETQKLNHDIRHHITAISGYIKDKNYDDLEKYIQNFQTISDYNVLPLCDNYTADIIIRYYVSIAHNNHIKVTYSFNLPSNIQIQESDLSILLGNLLENSVEACIRQVNTTRFISIKAKLTGKNMLSIIVKNSYDGKILTQADHTFISSKKGDQSIGTQSIKDIASKYNGIAKFEYTDDIFTSSIFLNPSV